MSHTITRGCALLLVLTAVALGACVPQLDGSGTATPISPASIPSPANPPPPEDWPTRWLRGIPCRPPCWEGITPGQTTAEEAVEVLNRSPVVATAEVTISPLNPEEGIVIWSWIGKEDQEGGQAIFYSQTPSSPIYAIYPDLPASFKLDDVIQAYGEPSHIIARSFYGPDMDSGVFYDLGLVYRSQGFMLGTGGILRPTLNADTLLGRVIFFAPTDEGLLAALGATAHLEKLVPWQGMKDFGYYCRDEEGNSCP